MQLGEETQMAGHMNFAELCILIHILLCSITNHESVFFAAFSSFTLCFANFLANFAFLLLPRRLPWLLPGQPLWS